MDRQPSESGALILLPGSHVWVEEEYFHRAQAFGSDNVSRLGDILVQECVLLLTVGESLNQWGLLDSHMQNGETPA